MMKKISTLTAAQIRTRRGIFTLGISTLLSLFAFVIRPKESQITSFGFVRGDEWALINQWDIDSRTGALVFVGIAALCTAYGYFRFIKDKKSLAFTMIGGFALLMSFLCWAGAGKFIPFTAIVAGGLVLAVPLIFGAMAGVICERSGVINIAIEGQLLAAAFAAGVVASLTKSTFWGLLVAPFAGALISVLLATFAIKYQIIVYLMYAAVALTHYYLFKTRWGLRTRAVGEHPTAADSVGIKVNALRFKNVIIAGAVAGLGGAYFTVGAVGAFSKEMTAGKGFIALAALIFGRWSPLGAVAAALLFGFADNLQVVLSIIGTGIPSEFLLMVPYIATIIAVSGFVGRVRAPAADGIPYSRGGSH